ncbi:MAG: cytochrome c3 family protein [Pirellulales bacterium]
MPASPDNLLPANEAKRRTARIEPDYLRHASALDVWKGRLALIAALGAMGWIAIAALGDRDQQLASRGAVAHAHAIWEHNCQACHVDFTPIAGSAGGLALTDWAHASDVNCQQCHAGPPHHHEYALLDAEADTQSANCATCHVEHQGRDADLLRVADRHCTVCHADLPSHSRRQSIDGFAASVESFSIDAHPKFRSLDRDPGRLEFNHALHMTAGLTHAKDGRGPTTIQSLPEEFRSQYAGKVVQNDLVQLDCSSCHELDRNMSTAQPDGLPDAVELPLGGGEYYRPVVYERHCQACHALPYQLDYDTLADAQLPHRLDAQQLERRVRERVLASLVRKTPELQARLETIPGNQPPQLLPETTAALIEQQVQQSARHLHSKAVCAKCHETSNTAAGDSAGSTFPEVAAVQVPAVWLKHARFDHSAHRAVTCVECHGRAYSNNADASRLASDVLLPNIENCVRCHAPRRELAGKIVGGARHNCVECHNYHGRAGGDDLLHGRGSSLRGAKKPRSIEQLLNLLDEPP